MPALQPTPLRLGWLFKMAWRDSRRSRSRLLLFTSSITLGIAALVAINSFRENLISDIEDEARELLGADLVVSHNQPLDEEVTALLDSLPGEQAAEKAFASMVVFPQNEGTRLVQVRALEGNFPWYGDLETDPAPAGVQFRGAQEAVIDRTVMLQFDAAPGDSVRVGRLQFAIAGTVVKVPGQVGIASTVAPPVFIPMRYLEETDLLQRGSRVVYRRYFRFPEEADGGALVDGIRNRLEVKGIRVETVQGRKVRVGQAFSNLNRFLNLVGFIALLLGCVGVASAVHLYIKEKLTPVAVLRCLGLSGRQAFLIYLIQVGGIGLLGSVAGAALGSVVQTVLPAVFKDFLPVDVNFSLVPEAIVSGILTGLGMALLFALVPLLSIRRVSPLLTINSFFSDQTGTDFWQRVVYLTIAAAIYGFAWWQMGDWLQAAIFSGGLAATFLLLSGLARGVMWLVRRFFPAHWSYLWRQSLANLYRPNNQTVTLIVSIGLGTTLLATLFFVQGLLLGQLQLSDQGDMPNMIVFEIRNEQRDAIREFAQERDFPVIQQVPVVGMRLAEVKGVPSSDLRKDTTNRIPNHIFDREYRVTYRDTLIDSEEGLGGAWPGNNTDPDLIGVSLEERLAGDMGVAVGDEVLFDVQGALVACRVVHIRRVDWTRIQTNFTVVFPTGVLEEAPQFHVLVTRASSQEASAAFQQELVSAFPNVSVVDLDLILKTVDEVLGQISFAIQFMALFSLLTGLLVLGGSVVVSKYQRIQEAVLLRTLGANRKQILAINAIEYLTLGGIATLSGIFLAMIAGWALTKYGFRIPFYLDVVPVLLILVVVTGLTVGIGLLNSRSILGKPPLEVLRKEV